jgi:hypothetical protein
MAVIEEGLRAGDEELPLVVVEESESVDVHGHMANLVFKLRAHSEPLNESFDADYSVGVEAGLEMAATMLENLMRQMGPASE